MPDLAASIVISQGKGNVTGQIKCDLGFQPSGSDAAVVCSPKEGWKLPNGNLPQACIPENTCTVSTLP
jgi:hypothetical protein